MNKNKSLFTGLVLLSLCLFSCKTTPKQEVPEPEESEPKIVLSRKLADTGTLTAGKLAAFFAENNDAYDEDFLLEFASYYIEEATAEGINSDVAFAQMCLETGFLRFGGLVQEEWNNFCGLGAMSVENPGEVFETEQMGVRAHIQHLQAYATTEDIELNNELVDPRYNWVHKTKFVEDIWGLAGTWATDPDYGTKLDELLNRMADSISE